MKKVIILVCMLLITYQVSSCDKKTADIKNSNEPETTQNRTNEENNTPQSPIKTEIKTIKLSSLKSTPFDTNKQDLNSPGSWSAKYGKTPEIIPYADGENLYIAWNDQKSNLVYIAKVIKNGNRYEAISSVKVETLGILMGFTIDEDENYYIASGKNEEPKDFPVPTVHRKGIVKIDKLDNSGKKIAVFDIDSGRNTLNSKSECILKPTVASSSRLLYSKDTLSLVHGINTPTGHQKSITTQIDSRTGKVIKTSTIWVSHSFDQRLICDDGVFIEMHLGDAYPRAVVISKNFRNDYRIKGYEIFNPKGPTGDNDTHTHLGGITKAEASEYSYLAVFSSERLNTNSLKDLALVKIKSNFNSLSQDGKNFIDTKVSKQTVTSGNGSKTNYIQWLTNNNNQNVDRSRIVSIGNDKFIILWEQWSSGNGRRQSYNGTFAMVINSKGEILKKTKKVSTNHISRGDDIAVLENKAVYITGNNISKNINLNFIDENLNYEKIIVQ